MEGEEPVLMATTSLSGMVYLMTELHAGSLAATMSPTGFGGGGSAGFMAGTHAGAPSEPHCSGASFSRTRVVAFPERAKAAYTVLLSGLTAIALGLSPYTGIALIGANVVVLNTMI